MPEVPELFPSESLDMELVSQSSHAFIKQKCTRYLYKPDAVLGSGEAEVTPSVHTIKRDKELQVFWYMCAEGTAGTDGLQRWGTVREGSAEEGNLEQNPVEAEEVCKMAQGNTGNTATKENEVAGGGKPRVSGVNCRECQCY